MHAVQAGVSERLLALLNGGAVAEVKSAVIANAQSKVLIVEFHQPIAARVLKEAQKLGALPYPVGAESKYEIPPLFYRLSGTFRQANPQLEHCAIRINPIAAVKRRCCGFCVRVLPVFNLVHDVFEKNAEIKYASDNSEGVRQLNRR